MKKLLQLSLVIVFALSTTFSFAQKKISNGLVKYEITKIDGDVPQLAMMKGTELNMFFLGEDQKMDINMMGGLMRVQTIMNAKDAQKNAVLMDMMGQKIQISDVGDKANEMSAGMMKLGDGSDFEVVYDKKDKKKIAGYKCHKATIKPKDGPSVDLYVTKKIKPANSQFQTMFESLVGFPLAMSIDTGMGIAITIEAQEVTGSVDKANFNVPDGYKQMTLEEFQEEMGGMMNLGF